ILGTRSHFPLEDFVFDPNTAPETEEWIYEGLMHVGEQLIWLAREKARKSTVLLQMMISAALGRNFLNFKYALNQPVKVVIVDYESSNRSLHKRYKPICDALGMNDEERRPLAANLTIIEVRKARKAGEPFPTIPTGDKDSKELHFWRTLVADHPADIYCIDPLRSAHDGDENDSKISQLL